MAASLARHERHIVLKILYLTCFIFLKISVVKGSSNKQFSVSEPNLNLVKGHKPTTSFPARGNKRRISKFKNWIGIILALKVKSVKSTAALQATPLPKPNEYKPLKIYLTCILITLLWIATGTLFYSICNKWPIPQSFFYSIDAGMSIGFCTDVVETKLISKAFTIIHILFGASIVGGALALFIQNAVQDLSSPKTKEYQLFLEQKVFENANVSHTGVLSYKEFKTLILSSVKDPILSEKDILILWNKFDRLKDGVIHFEEFVGTYRSIDRLVQSLKIQQKNISIFRPLRLVAMEIKTALKYMWQLEYRIYFCWIIWIILGIMWGTMNQKWDIITSTHFAISALATGGLTAPQVNEEGILPAGPSIFCGCYCLIGIPLFGLTLSTFAQALVKNHVSAMEAKALSRPMSPAEYDIAKHLTTKDSVVHLSDFIVMQLLRQGRISPETVHVLQSNFNLLDCDHTGTLTLEEATAVVKYG